LRDLITSVKNTVGVKNIITGLPVDNCCPRNISDWDTNIESETNCRQDTFWSIWKVKGNRERLEFDGTHQLLVYADDVKMLCTNVI